MRVCEKYHNLQPCNKNLFRHPIIKHLLASFLLVLFAFSVTPRKFLHDLVANHKDVPGKFAHDPHTRVQKSTYNCHTEDLVVESPYINGPAPVVPPAPVTACNRYAVSEIRLYTLFPVFLALRGPPSIA